MHVQRNVLLVIKVYRTYGIFLVLVPVFTVLVRHFFYVPVIAPYK